MRGVIAVVAALCFQATAALSQEITHVDVYEYGIYEIGEVLGDSAPPNLGYRHTYVSDVEHLETARVIPGSIGLTFGIRYRVEGDMPGALVPITTVIRFPPQGVLAPGQTERLYVDAVQSVTEIGADSFIAHTFDHPWEVAPGIWTIEVWSGDERLAEEHFEVITPPLS